MKKLLESFRFISKVVLFIILLAVGWAFVNVINLIKGKKSSDGLNQSNNLLGINKANADIPKSFSTPFLAYFNGSEYKLENDIMFGRPKSYWYGYETAKKMYEDGRIWPDLYKITAPIKSYGGKLLFQIQEIELEESFFKWLELRRIIHPKNTEVVVDSEYKKFYVLPKERFVESILTPEAVSMNNVNFTKVMFDKESIFIEDVNSDGVRFDSYGSLIAVFTGLEPGKIPYLVVKSWFRDWVLGLEEDWVDEKKSLFSYIGIKDFTKTVVSVILFILGIFIFQKKGVLHSITMSSLFFIGYGAGAGGGDGGAGDGSGDGSGSAGGSCTDCPCDADSCSCLCSFSYQYKDEQSNYNLCAISEPRAWHYNTEIIELPKESIKSDGTLELRINSSKRHVLGFMGVSHDVQKLDFSNYREEKIKLLNAYHSRYQKDVAEKLSSKNSKEFVQTVPGDIINLEFEEPQIKLADNEKETYIIRTSGFYTSLRPESLALAGNWRDKISAEAKSRLASLVKLKDYE